MKVNSKRFVYKKQISLFAILIILHVYSRFASALRERVRVCSLINILRYFRITSYVFFLCECICRTFFFRWNTWSNRVMLREELTHIFSSPAIERGTSSSSLQHPLMFFALKSCSFRFQFACVWRLVFCAKIKWMKTCDWMKIIYRNANVKMQIVSVCNSLILRCGR